MALRGLVHHGGVDRSVGHPAEATGHTARWLYSPMIGTAYDGAEQTGTLLTQEANEVMPPDYTNTERALRLNPPSALTGWLAEAAEPVPGPGPDLPAIADIYIDQVPPGSVGTLVQIRRFLGASWPFGDLRELLATQPFPAERAGSPRELRSSLERSVRLRPYLFHCGSDGELKPVWPHEPG